MNIFESKLSWRLESNLIHLAIWHPENLKYIWQSSDCDNMRNLYGYKWYSKYVLNLLIKKNSRDTDLKKKCPVQYRYIQLIYINLYRFGLVSQTTNRYVSAVKLLWEVGINIGYRNTNGANVWLTQYLSVNKTICSTCSSFV